MMNSWRNTARLNSGKSAPVTEIRKTTAGQATGIAGAGLLLWELGERAVAYMQGIAWQWSAIDLALVGNWLQQVLAVVAVIIGGIKSIDNIRGWLANRPPQAGPGATPPYTAPGAPVITRPPPDRPQVLVPDVGLYDSPQSPRNYFDQSELECKGMTCGCKYPGMDPVLMYRLNLFRAANGPTLINSAYRCEIHNAAVGGEQRINGQRGSYHLDGKAADIRNPRMTPEQIYQWFDERWPGGMGLILYDRFVHVDTRPGYYRDDRRARSRS